MSAHVGLAQLRQSGPGVPMSAVHAQRTVWRERQEGRQVRVADRRCLWPGAARFIRSDRCRASPRQQRVGAERTMVMGMGGSADTSCCCWPRWSSRWPVTCRCCWAAMRSTSRLGGLGSFCDSNTWIVWMGADSGAGRAYVRGRYIGAAAPRGMNPPLSVGRLITRDRRKIGAGGRLKRDTGKGETKAGNGKGGNGTGSGNRKRKWRISMQRQRIQDVSGEDGWALPGAGMFPEAAAIASAGMSGAGLANGVTESLPS